MKITGADKFNNGLSNVIFKITFEFGSGRAFPNRKINFKFYLDSESLNKHPNLREYIDGKLFDSILKTTSANEQEFFITKVFSSLIYFHNHSISELKKKFLHKVFL